MRRESNILSVRRRLLIPFLLAGLIIQQGVQSSALAGSTVLMLSSTAVSRLPLIKKVELDPSTPVTGDKLRAVVQVDGEEAPFSQLRFRWKVNGQGVQESWEGALEWSFKRGDIIEVEVTPTDGLNSGESRRSSTIVGNASPTLRIVDQTMDDQGAYRARLEAEDPEGDSITFSLKSGPPGATVDATTGAILWTAEAGEDTDFSIQVSAKDEVGAETILSYQVKARWQENVGGGEHATETPASKQ